MQSHELDRALGRVEGKVDGLEHSIREIKSMLQESHNDITKRVSSLEHSRSKLLGTASAIGAAFGVFGGWLTTNLLPRIPH
jgi:hypothetical protein